jgi:pimeloyl-ACP methyl ester carboxylesterase
MIPVFAAAGKRVIAPDFFGFGRSDKPVADESYTFDFHRGSLLAFIDRLELGNLTLVVQDWGGLLGLTVPMEMPDRVSRLLIMNTSLGTGEHPLPPAFLAWREWSNKNPDMRIAGLMSRACPHLSPEECAAYEAPFPDSSYKAGVRRFPNLVADRPEAPGADIARRARDWLRNDWKGRSFMAIGMQDEILGPVPMRALHAVIRNCPEPLELAEAGHFVQEWGDEVAGRALVSFDS